jgi:hypothetical protein
LADAPPEAVEVLAEWAWGVAAVAVRVAHPTTVQARARSGRRGGGCGLCGSGCDLPVGADVVAVVPNGFAVRARRIAAVLGAHARQTAVVARQWGRSRCSGCGWHGSRSNLFVGASPLSIGTHSLAERAW